MALPSPYEHLDLFNFETTTPSPKAPTSRQKVPFDSARVYPSAYLNHSAELCQNDRCRAAETAHWVKYLLPECEALCSGLRTHVEARLGCEGLKCMTSPMLVDEERIARACWLANIAKRRKLLVWWETLFHGNKITKLKALGVCFLLLTHYVFSNMTLRGLGDIAAGKSTCH